METNNKYDQYINHIDAGIIKAEDAMESVKEKMPVYNREQLDNINNDNINNDYSNSLKKIMTYSIMHTVMQVAKDILQSNTGQVTYSFDSTNQEGLGLGSKEKNVLLSAFNTSCSIIEQRIKPIKELGLNSDYYRMLGVRLAMWFAAGLATTVIVTAVLAILYCCAIVSPTLFGIIAGATIGAALLPLLAAFISDTVGRQYYKQYSILRTTLPKIIDVGIFNNQTTIIKIDSLKDNPIKAPFVKLAPGDSVRSTFLFTHTIGQNTAFEKLIKHREMDLNNFKSQLITDDENQDQVQLRP